MKMKPRFLISFIKSIIIQKKGLKVIWKPDEDVFDKESFKDVSDYFRIEVNYKSKESKLFEIEITFNKKGQMFVKKSKAKRTEINTELNQSKNKYLRFSTLSEAETIKELKELLPQEVLDELMKNGYVYEDKKKTILISITIKITQP